MQNWWRNEKLLRSFVNTDNYRFQSLQKVSAKIALQLKDNEWREVHQYFKRTNFKIIVESWDETLMHKWVHQAIAKCIEEDHWDFYFLSKITWNDQSRMNEKVYKDCQEHAMNEKKLLNCRWLNRVHSSMWQEEQDHQKTEMQWVLKDHAECQTILKRTVQNCEMSKKCNCRHIDLSNNFSSD